MKNLIKTTLNKSLNKALCNSLCKMSLSFSALLLTFVVLGNTVQAAEEIEPDVRAIQVNGRDVMIDVAYPSQTWYSIRGLTTEQPNTFAIDNMEDYEVYLDGQLVENGDSIDITLEQLAPNIGIPFTLLNKSTGDEKKSFIRTLHSAYDLKAGDISDDATDGYYYFTQGDMMYKMDVSGNVVYYQRGNIQVRDFRPWTIDGDIYYTYLEDTGDNVNAGPTGCSRAIIMDSEYNVIDTVESLSVESLSDELSVTSELPLGNYDFIMLDVGHYLISTNITPPAAEEVPTTEVIPASIVQEIEYGELVFEWSSTDYMGCNSIDIDPADGNVVLSFCELDTVLKVDRETSEILWILGGAQDEFGLTDEQKFSHQNFVKFSDEGVLTLYDNGFSNQQTRALQFVLDEDTKKVTSYYEYEATNKYTASMGSAMCLDSENSIFLMGWGSRTGDCNLFSEINAETGEILFELYDSDLEEGAATYRVYKFPTFD